MAKKSSIEKNNRRRKMTKQAAGRRARLKAIIMDKTKPGKNASRRASSWPRCRAIRRRRGSAIAAS